MPWRISRAVYSEHLSQYFLNEFLWYTLSLPVLVPVVQMVDKALSTDQPLLWITQFGLPNIYSLDSD